jgi:hypothetical protein
MSTLKVGGIRGVSASSDAITVANDGSCTANITNNLSNRNLIINGAMQVAQRGTSSTTTGYQTVDRFTTATTGVDEAPTFAQADVASGTTPYTLGFRKAFKITNGNQTSGAGATDRVEVMARLEAQDIANSGWNYTSSSSFVTLSFWIKSSVAQNFFLRIESQDGTAQRYAVETGSLSADTWTKVTKQIPGNSNLQFDNNNGEGLRISFYGFLGTDNTDSSSLNTWAASASGNRTPDQTSTWYTTNDATLEITGVQLEVDHTGSGVATDFEHRPYGHELALCQRYYEIGVHGNYGHVAGGGTHKFYSQFKTQKRAAPTLAILSSQENYVSSVGITADPMDATLGCRIQGAVVGSATGDNKYIDAKFSSDAEL